MQENLTKYVLKNGGSIVPLFLDFKYTNGTGIFNPSVFYDSVLDKLFVNIRHCQYTLYHSEKNKFESQWGPLSYLNPENDMTLTTTNYMCELDKDTLAIQSVLKVDTSTLDVKPIWEFVGLEDCRVVRWDNKLYITGVRRDTTTNGQGRMELSELEYNNSSIKEIFRYRIPSTANDASYCEKNWMPIDFMPYHYVKWSNPTEIVFADMENKKTTQTFLGKSYNYPRDIRGGSQVIKLNNNYNFACGHTVHLFKSEIGAKDAIYRHCFIVWDNDWNVKTVTNQFAFLNANIEFSAGMTKFRDSFLVSFGLQDNCCYLLKIPQHLMETICQI